MSKWVYDFAEGSKDMRELLGGKGANVAEMTRVLGPDPDLVDLAQDVFVTALESITRLDEARALPPGDRWSGAFDAVPSVAPFLHDWLYGTKTPAMPGHPDFSYG